MDIGSILLLLGICIVVFLFVYQPFMDARKQKVLVTEALPVLEKEMHVSSLMAERDRILLALQELEFDYNLGKIPEEDYPIQRQFLLKRGAEVIKTLDEIKGNSSEDNVIQQIETALEENRVDGPKFETKTEKDLDIESLIAARKRSKEVKPDGFCPKCGKPISKNDKFCSKCGTPL
jgi:hypothetical protein